MRMEACKKAVKNKFCVDIRTVRLNFLGLPRSGKTSFRLRASGVIVNISWATETKGQYVQPSTGVAEDGGQVILRIECSDMGTISAKEWSALKDLPEEAAMFSQLFYQAVHAETSASPNPSAHTAHPNPLAHPNPQPAPNLQPLGPIFWPASSVYSIANPQAVQSLQPVQNLQPLPHLLLTSLKVMLGKKCFLSLVKL